VIERRTLKPENDALVENFELKRVGVTVIGAPVWRTSGPPECVSYEQIASSSAKRSLPCSRLETGNVNTVSSDGSAARTTLSASS